MYPPRPTTNEDVAAARAVLADLFNMMGRGIRKVAKILSVRHYPPAQEKPKSRLENQ